jgi:hypothetical protein
MGEPWNWTHHQAMAERFERLAETSSDPRLIELFLKLAGKHSHISSLLKALAAAPGMSSR